ERTPASIAQYWMRSIGGSFGYLGGRSFNDCRAASRSHSHVSSHSPVNGRDVTRKLHGAFRKNVSIVVTSSTRFSPSREKRSVTRFCVDDGMRKSAFKPCGSNAKRSVVTTSAPFS